MRAGLIAFALLLLLPGAAHAELKLCNRSSYIVYAATAQAKGSNRQTQGWTRIVPGDCETALTNSLAGQNTLVYARSALAHSGPQRAWGGKALLCVRDVNFNLRQGAAGARCGEGGSFAAPFAAIATQGRPGFTMNLDEQPALPSLPAAQLAGVKRLLKDNGYAVGAINGQPDKATGKSLETFRARMKFTPNAGNTELFAALESQALKTVVPAGYTVCNERKDELLVAMGERGKTVISRGWWRIAAGACARTITAALSTDAVWLLAQKADGTVVAGGPERFCITPLEFEIQRSGDCAARGQTEAGFAKTVTRGAAGYTARVGDTGLMAH